MPPTKKEKRSSSCPPYERREKSPTRKAPNKTEKRSTFRADVVWYILFNFLALGVSLYAIYVSIKGLTASEDKSCYYQNDEWLLGFGIYGCLVILIIVSALFTSRIWIKLLQNVHYVMLFGGGIACGLIMLFVFMMTKNPEYDGTTNMPWLGKQILTDKRWGEIKICFERNEVCKPLLSDPSIKPDTTIEMNCCRAPRQCALQYRNGTYWEVSEDPQCEMWKEKAGGACYDCVSCKRGYIWTIIYAWIKVIMFLVVFGACLGVSYLAEESMYEDNHQIFKGYRTLMCSHPEKHKTR